ncbi:MAG TPA: AmmeMemoRadiSam system protein B, partial [Oligoflexia bacterium]|nr:AmmeMemoRadiSam system protein B [Oligoflexia bacterium]
MKFIKRAVRYYSLPAAGVLIAVCSYIYWWSSANNSAPGGNQAVPGAERKQEQIMQKYKVRPPVVAGQFYPGSAGDLKREIAGYLNQAALTDLPGAVKALIVPHAGYVYSGLVAAYGY